MLPYWHRCLFKNMVELLNAFSECPVMSTDHEECTFDLPCIWKCAFTCKTYLLRKQISMWMFVDTSTVLLEHPRRVHIGQVVCGLKALRWRHNERDGVSNHQPHDCLLNRLFRRRSKKIPKLRVTGLCAGNSPVTGEFPAQRASNAENVSIWWRHLGNDRLKMYVHTTF